MKERVLEILVFIMSEIRENKKLSDIDLGDLKNRGYTHSEISAAFSWLCDNLPFHDGVLTRSGEPSEGSHRLLHEAEKALLSTEGQGYLMQLRELGLLDSRDLENVIERVMLAGYEKLSTSELHEIVSAVLFSRPGRGPGGTLLNSGETIH